MADTWTDVAFATRQVLTTVGELPEGSQTHPSLCPGWTRGHVLTHLARNADGLGHLVTWATTGVETPMYASAAARAADIEAGAGRSLAELAADLDTASTRLAQAAAALRPRHDAVRLLLRGGVPERASQLGFRRLREVIYHHVDLDAGFGFADVPPDLRMAFLDDEVMRLQDNPAAPAITVCSDEGDLYPVAGSTAYVTGSQAALLGWLARGLTAGVACDGGLPVLPKGS